jgi:hypothetical protein
MAQSFLIKNQTRCAVQPAHAADRFAREIVGILALSYAARLRQLMRNPLDGISSFTQTCLYYLLFDTHSLNG